MPRPANGRRLAPQVRPAPPVAETEKVVRVGRPANDNLPHWALKTGRTVVIAGFVLVALVIAALIFV